MNGLYPIKPTDSGTFAVKTNHQLPTPEKFLRILLLRAVSPLMAPEATDSPGVPDYTSDYDRSEVADNLQEAMTEAFYNATDGRVRNAENERVRVKWLNSAIKASAEYRQQIDALEAEEREQRIERLESQLDDLLDS